MFKKLQTWLFSGLAAMLAFIAYTGVSTNSLLVLHEPDIPESLKVKD